MPVWHLFCVHLAVIPHSGRVIGKAGKLS